MEFLAMGDFKPKILCTFWGNSNTDMFPLTKTQKSHKNILGKKSITNYKLNYSSYRSSNAF
jgi:hypothetical protein